MITVADVLRVFPGVRALSEDEAKALKIGKAPQRLKPVHLKLIIGGRGNVGARIVTCQHCGGPIVDRIWPGGRQDRGCHYCGRRARVSNRFSLRKVKGEIITIKHPMWSTFVNSLEIWLDNRGGCDTCPWSSVVHDFVVEFLRDKGGDARGVTVGIRGKAALLEFWILKNRDRLGVKVETVIMPPDRAAAHRVESPLEDD